MYNKEFFDKGLNRTHTSCAKWDEMPPMHEGDVPLWVADMDFEGAKCIGEAIQKRAEHPCFGYTLIEDEDYNAFTNFVNRRHDMDIQKENTCMMPCVVTGLKNAVRMCTNEQDSVAIFTPVYGPFYYSILENNRTVIECPFIKNQDNTFAYDFELLEDILKKGTKLVLMCSPHNPMSKLVTKEELLKTLELVRKYNATLVVDEIHAEFVYEKGAFTPIMNLVNEKDKVLSFMSASKTFNVAGLQQAMLVSKNKEMLDTMCKNISASGIVSGNIFALCATRAAYNEGESWLDGLLDYLKGNISFLQKFVQENLPKAHLTPIQATYLAWLDMSAYEQDMKKLMDKLCAQGVVVSAGTGFGELGKGYIRINFGCSLAQLKEGMERIAKAVQ